MKLKITSDIDLCNQPLQQTGLKLQAICEVLPVEPDKIVGFNNSCDVDFDFYDSNGIQMANLKGSYLESNDTMPSVLTIGTNQYKLNWHPFDTMGGLDEDAFVKQLSL